MGISRVSPKTRYFPASNAATIVLPPETYSVNGSLKLVDFIPTSICAKQWFTPIKGILLVNAKVLETIAPVRRQGPLDTLFGKSIKLNPVLASTQQSLIH